MKTINLDFLIFRYNLFDDSQSLILDSLLLKKVPQLVSFKLQYNVVLSAYIYLAY